MPVQSILNICMNLLCDCGICSNHKDVFEATLLKFKLLKST